MKTLIAYMLCPTAFVPASVSGGPTFLEKIVKLGMERYSRTPWAHGIALSLTHDRSGSGYEMVDTLRRLEGRPYPAYRDVEGSWTFGGQVLLLSFARLETVQEAHLAWNNELFVTRREQEKCVQISLPPGS